MKKQRWIFNTLLALVLTFSLLAGATGTAQADNDKPPGIDPGFLRLVQDNPDAMFKVIVQKDAKNKDLKDMELEDAVRKAGSVGKPVLHTDVCIMDRDADSLGRYQRMVQTLRGAGIRAELFQGNPKQFGKQLQYADRRGSAVAVIQGGDERANDQVTLKDLIAGREAAKDIADRADWVEQRPAQVTVAYDLTPPGAPTVQPRAVSTSSK